MWFGVNGLVLKKGLWGSWLMGEFANLAVFERKEPGD